MHHMTRPAAKTAAARQIMTDGVENVYNSRLREGFWHWIANIWVNIILSFRSW